MRLCMYLTTSVSSRQRFLYIPCLDSGSYLPTVMVWLKKKNNKTHWCFTVISFLREE